MSSNTQPDASTARDSAQAPSQPSQPPPPDATATDNDPANATPAAPLTPGPRAIRLQQLYTQSLKHTLNKISWDNFSSCYPTIASQAPTTLRAVQKQMVDRLGQLCNKEFDSIMTNRNVVAKLNELEEMIADAASRRGESLQEGVGDATPPIPPHTLPPETILAAHLAPHLAAHQSQLNARLQTVQSRNAMLWEDIQGQRAEISALLDSLDSAMGDVDSATNLLDPIVADLSKETRDVEVEMADADAQGR